MHQFELPLTILPSDIDALGHVNNVVYVRWMQEAAAAHWEAAAPAELRATVAWVVVRHEIDYKQPALPRDRLLARTWVGAPTGATWERFVEIRRIAEGKVLVRGRTVYAPIDPITGKPRRLSRELRAPFGGNHAPPGP
jgi:acyl-CoA thioester hydrolase